MLSLPSAPATVLHVEDDDIDDFATKTNSLEADGELLAEVEDDNDAESEGDGVEDEDEEDEEDEDEDEDEEVIFTHYLLIFCSFFTHFYSRFTHFLLIISLTGIHSMWLLRKVILKLSNVWLKTKPQLMSSLRMDGLLSIWLVTMEVIIL